MMLVPIKLKPNSEQIMTNLDKFGADGLRGEHLLFCRHGGWRRTASGGPARHGGGWASGGTTASAQQRWRCGTAGREPAEGVPEVEEKGKKELASLKDPILQFRLIYLVCET
jgi:hypothetical protein